MKKRLLSAFLALVMSIALFPVTVSAVVHPTDGSEFFTDAAFDWKDLNVQTDADGNLIQMSAAAWYNYDASGQIAGRQYGFYVVETDEDNVATAPKIDNLGLDDFNALMTGAGKRIDMPGTYGGDREWITFTLDSTDCNGMNWENNYNIWFWTSDGVNANTYESKIGPMTGITINRYMKDSYGSSADTSDYMEIDTVKSMNIEGQKLSAVWKEYPNCKLNIDLSNEEEATQPRTAGGEFVYNLYFDKVEPIPYLDWDNASKTTFEAIRTDAYEVVTSETTALADGKWYVVQGDVTVETRINVGGSVNLILCDGAKLTAEEGISVISKDGNVSSLTVYGQTDGTGMIIADASATNHTGIGGMDGNANNNCGSVTINGGIIEARGGHCKWS